MNYSMKRQFALFVLRWILNTIGIWVAVRLLGVSPASPDTTAMVSTFVIAGLIFSIVNSVLKPIITILALPAILLTLGLFTLVVNGLMVYISLALAPNLSISFGDAIIAGIVLSLVNYIVSNALDLRSARET
jgi:putative membrane protein